MPKPSACGFPDSTNTGVPPGTPLSRVDGSVVISTPGAVFANREVHGSITVNADNVTIERVRLISDNDYALRTFGPNRQSKNVTIRDTEIDMQGRDDIKGIAFSEYTATRVWFHNGLDCAHMGDNVVITDSFCDLPVLRAGSSAHADGFQSDGGGNYIIRHNTIRNPNGQTSAILMSTNTSPISTVVIDNNLMSGGGYTVYCGTDEGGLVPNETYTNNVISKEFFSKGGRWGPTTWCDKVATASGNVWDGNYHLPAGTPVAPRTGSPAGGGTNNLAGRLSAGRARRVTRMALARELGRRVTRRSGGFAMHCHRRSLSVIACAVRWRGHRHASGGAHRYSGIVVVTRVAAGKRRYALRIRDRSSGSSRSIRRRGRL